MYGPSYLPWQNEPGYAEPDYGGYPQYGSNSLVQALPSIMYGFHGLSTGPQAGIAQQLGQVASAQMDIDNPLYKKIYGQQKQQGQQNLAEMIAQLSAQNRKLSSMGRVPLFDPERGGEQLFRGLSQGYQDVQNQAGANTQNALAGAAHSLYPAFTAQSSLALQKNQDQYQKAKAQTGVAGILTHLFGL